MSYGKCVIDASFGIREGRFCFCPIDGDPEGDFDVLTGLNYLSDVPPKTMQLVAIVHENGQEAVERFCEEYEAELEELKARLLGEEED